MIPTRQHLGALSLLLGRSITADAFVPTGAAIRPNIDNLRVTCERTMLRQRTSDAAYSRLEYQKGESSDEENCLIGENVVEKCAQPTGTESQTSAALNLSKCICGAGSFALPHVFLEEGVAGGTLALTTCGVLAILTMQSLSDSKMALSEKRGEPITSYVQLARASLGENAAKVVFALTLAASLGVCSTYLVFIGSTLESMSCDVGADNIVRQFAPNVSELNWEIYSSLFLLPLSLIRDYSIFAFTSALGVFAVLGGIVVTLLYGIVVDPGGGISVAIGSIRTLPMWPTSLSAAFGGSFGTICYLFAVNFLTFPVINSMKDPYEYNGAVSKAVASVWTVNVIFAIITLGFYREDTQDLVLANLANGPYLSALKLLLCVDLLFTFPIVFSSGRQILENALIGQDEARKDESFPVRAAIVAGAVSSCFGLAQIGGFGAVANLVGGVAQGTLAFVMPPAIALSLRKERDEFSAMKNDDIALYSLLAFGVLVVSSVTYFTFAEM